MGTYYLFKMMLMFKDVRVALVAYNCGPGFVQEMQKRGIKAAESMWKRSWGITRRSRFRDVVFIPPSRARKTRRKAGFLFRFLSNMLCY